MPYAIECHFVPSDKLWEIDFSREMPLLCYYDQDEIRVAVDSEIGLLCMIGEN